MVVYGLVGSTVGVDWTMLRLSMGFENCRSCVLALIIEHCFGT